MTKTRSSAWPLALLLGAVVLYASLYPFVGWRDQGVEPWAYLLAPLPQYWTGFDVASNLLGYVPLGFLLGVALVRSGRSLRAGWLGGAIMGAALSLGVETLQNYLPMRVPSNVDLLLNSVGALIGASLMVLAWRLGLLRRWAEFRARWLEPSAHGGLVLLALWPLALLYPAPVPFGLGHIWERLEGGLVELLMDTPFVEWLPLRLEPPSPLSPLAEAFCISLSLLSPVLLAFSDMRFFLRRALFLPVFFLGAFAVAGLSASLTYGPTHAWAWVSPQVVLGMGVGLLAGLVALPMPRRLCLVLMLMSLATSLSLLNGSPDSPYFEQSLEVWEQGRFIRFHGVSQWLGWLWPFAAMAYGLRAVVRQWPAASAH